MLARQANEEPVAEHEGVAVVIAIIDYRAGNLTSVKKAFDHVGAETVVTADAAQVAKADKIVLPGVGHFHATTALDNEGLRDAVISGIERGMPFLGICVGMQWMLASSEEAPDVHGLGLWRVGRAGFAAALLGRPDTRRRLHRPAVAVLRA